MNPKELRSALFADFKPVTAAEWEEKIRRDLKKEDLSDLATATYEDIAIKPFYTASDALYPPQPEAIPGKFPYTRGFKTSTNHWQNIQDILVSNESRPAIDKAVLARQAGADGIHFKIDDPETFDLPYLVSQLNPEQVIFCFSLPGQPGLFLARLHEQLKNQQYSPQVLQGFMAIHLPHNTEISLATADQLASMLENTKEAPNFYGIAVNGAQFGNRGATMVQEIAFILSMAVDYTNQLAARGFSWPDIYQNMQFLVSTGTHYFFEIAKLRALRWLWSSIVKATAEKPEYAAHLRLHAASSRWFATTFDPHINILRTTTEAMAAVLGGCNSVAVAPFDITFNQNNPFSERIARNIPLILQHEAYLNQVLDPAAGSYYLESLTRELAEKAWTLFQEIEARGGFTQALNAGFILKELLRTSHEKFKALAAGQDILVGSNKFGNKQEKIAYDVEALIQSRYFDTSRVSYPLEVMRLAAVLHYQKKNARPKAIIAVIGTDIQEHIHAAFAKEFFECGDFETEVMRFDSVQAALEKLLFIDCKAIVFSSTESEYNRFASRFTDALKQHKKRPLLILAASPTEMKEELEENGFDGRIFQNCNAASIIGRIQERLLNYEL